MSDPIRQLEPQRLWHHFADLNAIPRASKNESRVIEFAKSFGESLGLSTTVDKAGNVIIRKPATEGRENHLPVVLQSHLDMVHQKNSNSDFDFDNQGIEMFVEGDWVHARETTLGADNGIGVASIMAVLESQELSHPPLEALFTIDEETGMTGALELEPGTLNGCILLNLDTEEDNELTIGCAGGVDVVADGSYEPVPVESDWQGWQIRITELTGGHSGLDIHLGRGNANKLMNRLLWLVNQIFECVIHSIDGGTLRNAIPRESVATIAVGPPVNSTLSDPSVNDRDRDRVETVIATAIEEIRREYSTTDPELEIVCNKVEIPANGLSAATSRGLLTAVYSITSGIYRMSPDVAGLVQTSNNLARVKAGDGKIHLACLTRSSVDSERDDLAAAIKSLLELVGLEVNMANSYPGWRPAPESKIVSLMSQLYTELHGDSAHVAACHAGLECGIIGQHYPDLEMISFGPNIRGAHSPDEKVQISSVQKFWRYFVETLNRIPAA